MTIKLYKEPKLERPDLICGWPGIGRIGIMAVDYLRRAIAGKELGEIEPWDFFEPRKVTIRDGLLKDLVSYQQILLPEAQDKRPCTLYR